MLDLETLSTRPEAVILSIGALKFDPYTDVIDLENNFDIKVDVDEQVSLGRHIQPETIDWWAKQPKDVQEDAFSLVGRDTIDSFLTKLNKFLVGADSIWAQGPVFDIVILENLYRQVERPVPWNYWQIRDSRTLFKVHGDPRDKGRAAAHNAVMDCYYQAVGIQQIYRQCNIVKT